MITKQVARDMEYCQLAADWLEENGWCQKQYYEGTWSNQPETCCIAGALNFIQCGSATGGVSVAGWSSLMRRVQKATPSGSISSHNDDEFMTKDKAIHFLRHAGVEKSRVRRE